MNTKLNLPTGAALEIQTAPFETVMDAIQIIARELLKVDLKIDGGALERLKSGGDFSAADLDISFLKDGMLVLLASKDYRAVLGEMMKSCTYKGIKVDGTTWEPEQAREDYFSAAWEVSKKNVAPFFKKILSSLLAAARTGKPDVPTSG